MTLIFLCAMGMSSFAQATQTAYSHQRPDALRALFQRADTRADRLLVQYRLYPLTKDAAILEDLPQSLSSGSAREYALLAGLWAYRAGEASVFGAVSAGRRSTRLLEQAKARDPDGPLVLLVEGQSLLYRPSIFGGNAAAAADRFRRLARIVKEEGAPEVTRTEAQVWQWLALREAGQSAEAESVRAALRTRDLPPLYAQFLRDPPTV